MYKLDLHIHTIASGHAANTFDELCTYASQKKMKCIGITDHGPSMEGASHDGYFWLAKRLPKKIGDLNVLFGIEANINDTHGTIDLSDELLEFQDIVIAGLHKRTPYIKQVENNCVNNTKAIIAAIESGKCNIISHPIVEYFDVDIKEITECAISNDVLLELNGQIFEQMNQKLLEQYCYMVEIVSKYHGMVILGSDTHYKNQLGDFSTILKYSQILGLNDSIIMNQNIEELRRFNIFI